jgi:hypothetical protein
MPLADKRRFITRVLNHLWKRPLRAIEEVTVAAEAIDVTVLAREDAGAGRPADRVRAKGVPVDRPFLREPVNVRRLIDLRTQRADRLHGMVIREDENDVGSLLRGVRSQGTDENNQGGNVSHGRRSVEGGGQLTEVESWLRPLLGTRVLGLSQIAKDLGDFLEGFRVVSRRASLP